VNGAQLAHEGGGARLAGVLNSARHIRSQWRRPLAYVIHWKWAEVTVEKCPAMLSTVRGARESFRRGRCWHRIQSFQASHSKTDPRPVLRVARLCHGTIQWHQKPLY
jgi:hypothetical protein